MNVRYFWQKVTSRLCCLIHGWIIPIDRSEPFDPVKFIGEGWSVWRGPPDGSGLSGKEDQDERSLKLESIPARAIRLENMLKGGEKVINPETRLERLKKVGHIRLDAKILQTFWQNQGYIPDFWWRERKNGRTFVYFNGTILRGPDGGRYELCLCFFDELQWRYYQITSAAVKDASDPSAVL